MIIFFFRQSTAYEMRISDWSSDVCSSDLIGGFRNARRWALVALARHRPRAGRAVAQVQDSGRSEDRRVGKECVSTCRSRWSPHHYKKKTILHTLIPHHTLLPSDL